MNKADKTLPKKYSKVEGNSNITKAMSGTYGGATRATIDEKISTTLLTVRGLDK